MPRIPDRFDLWIRKARACPDETRQTDYVLGTLAGLAQWHFLNVGTKEHPQPAETEIAGGRHLLLFTDAGRIEELFPEGGKKDEPLPVISIPTVAAMAWCLERQAGLLVNPGEDAALVPFAPLEKFHAEWLQRGGRQASGFWIPHVTTEEEDFWREHGL